MLDEICPTLAASAEGRAWFANWLRVGASPAMGYELNRAFMETDMAEVYAALRVPTLRAVPRDALVERRVDRRRGSHTRRTQRPACRAPTTGGSSFRRRSPRRSSSLAAGSSTPPVPETILFDPALHRHRRVERARREPGGSGLARPARTPPCRGAARARTLPGDVSRTRRATASSSPSTALERAVACAHAVIAAVEPLGPRVARRHPHGGVRAPRRQAGRPRPGRRRPHLRPRRDRSGSGLADGQGSGRGQRLRIRRLPENTI